MADLLSEITKTEKGKAIIMQTPIASNSVGLHVPIKLTRDNFLLWKTQIFPLLNFHDLAHILTQDPQISTQINDQGGITVSPEYQAWWRQDQQVLSLIVSSLSESVLSCVIGKNTAKEAWSALSTHCSSTNPSCIMHLHNRLHNNSKGTRCVTEFVQEIQRTCDELAAAGHPVEETVSIYTLLRGLGPTYSSFCAGISSNLSHLSLSDVIAQINSYDELLKFSNLIKETTTIDFPLQQIRRNLHLLIMAKVKIMVEMAVEKAEMVEDMYLDVNYVDNMGIEYWNAENDSIYLFSDIKMSHNFRVPNQLHKPIISIYCLHMYHRITRIGIPIVEQHTMLQMMCIV